MAAAAVPVVGEPVPNTVSFGPGNNDSIIQHANLAELMPQGYEVRLDWPDTNKNLYISGCTMYIGRVGENFLGSGIGCMYISYMPGCCGVLVFHNLSRRSTHASATDEVFLQCGERIARACGYSKVMYTTIPHQTGVIAAMKLRGWTKQDTFRSVRTGSDITTWFKLVA